MYVLHKNFTIIYREAGDHIIVTSIAAHGILSRMYGEKEYATIHDVIKDIDAGKFGS